MSDKDGAVARLIEHLSDVQGASALYLKHAMEAADTPGAGGILKIYIAPRDKKVQVEWSALQHNVDRG